MKQHSAPAGGFSYFHMFTSLLLERQAQDVKGCFITIIGENGENLQKWLKWASQRKEEERRR